MAGVEPYAPCPCGSGEKFKWCCQKVEAFADRARRLVESGQAEAAIKALDEGLRKAPGNPWLLTRKAIIQVRQGQAETAKSTLRQVLAGNAKHFGALVLLTRCVLETEGPVNGAGMFQQVLGAVDDDRRPDLASLARVVAYLLGERRLYPAALKHLELVDKLAGAPDRSGRSIEASPSVSPWLKDRLGPAPIPGHLYGEQRERYARALGLIDRGFWAPAAAAFDAISAGDPGGDADYNLGLCRLWLGDQVGAVGPLRRRSRRLGDSIEAVDLEALCQLIEPPAADDRVELIQMIWPIRDRDALLATLRAADDIFDEGPEPIEPDDPDSEGVEVFALLDRPLVEPTPGVAASLHQIPLVLGRVSIGPDLVALEAYDDGRVNNLGDRFTAMAGRSIDGADPKTQVLGIASRSALVLEKEWVYQLDAGPEEAARLEREQHERLLRETWAVAPKPYLGNRSPAQAARDGDAQVPLRAALCLIARDGALGRSGFDFDEFRRWLGVATEPPIDPESVDIDRLSTARLDHVPADRLDDGRLVKLYHRARRAMAPKALEAASLALVDRPALFGRDGVDSVAIHSDLAGIAAGRGDRQGSESWIARGRQADSPIVRARNAPLWDMVEVRLRARLDPPEAWVPELAVVLDRYAQDSSASQILMLSLVEMGLIQMQPNPDSPADVLMDSRPLQALLAEFGPRVTTASGRLGVSAAKPEVWTPGGPASGQGGGIWTPGSAAPAPSGEKSKLILPGR